MKNKKAAEILMPVLMVVIFAAAGIGLSYAVFSQTGLLAKIQQVTILGDPNCGYTAEAADGKDSGVITDFRRPAADSRYGLIRCSAIKLKAPLYYGDTDKVFEKGAGQYMDSGCPGEGTTILVGGHDTTYFKTLGKLKKGQIVDVSTGYGQFRYKVDRIRKGKAADTDLWQLDAKKEQLVMYTCWPFGSIFGERSGRYYVYAAKVSGPVIAKGAAQDE